MAKLLEHEGKAILAAYGIPVPRGEVARTPEEAAAAVARLGRPAFLKGLVPTNRRGKAGGVLAVGSAEEALSAAATLLGRRISGYPITAILVEEAVTGGRECFLSISYDGLSRQPLVLLSLTGGVDVESQLQADPTALVRQVFDPRFPLEPFKGRELARRAGLSGRAVVQVGQIIARLSEAFLRRDLHLAEINPLTVSPDGDAVAIGALLAVDDQALPRQDLDPAILARRGEERVGRPLTPLERRMQEIDNARPGDGAIRFTEFEDGDIGFMIMGGGGSLVCLDVLYDLGARPATYFDITAGDVEEKMYEATKLVLSKPGLRALVIGSNITAFTQVDKKVSGVVRALKSTGIDLYKFPVLVRLTGPGDERAAKLAAEMPGLHYFRDEVTLEDVMVRSVELARGGQV